jgi:hypothetical protein
MEEYQKTDWINGKESPCHKCSSYGQCIIPVGCRNWKIWYFYQAGNQNKVKQLQEEILDEAV